MTPQYQIFHVIGTTTHGAYDVYTDFVVVAENENDARCTHPKDYVWIDECWMQSQDGGISWHQVFDTTWYDTPYTVNCHQVGTALPGTGPGIVCRSFNAG